MARSKVSRVICYRCKIFRGAGGRHLGSKNCDKLKEAFEKDLLYPSFFEPNILTNEGVDFITAHIDGHGRVYHMTPMWVAFAQRCRLQKKDYVSGRMQEPPWLQRKSIERGILRTLKDPDLRDVRLAEMEMVGIPENWGFGIVTVKFPALELVNRFT